MSIESHCMTDCNITATICVTTYHSECVVNLLFTAQDGLSRNGLMGPIEPHLLRENSNAFAICTANVTTHTVPCDYVTRN